MNYNKLFLISLSLIYSANVFSNTDSPSPNMGNSLESNQETNASDNNLDSKKRKYRERVVYSLPQYEHAQQPIGFNRYIESPRITGNSPNIEYIVAAPIFDGMIALFTKNSDSTVPPLQLNLSEAPIEKKREVLRYLWGERAKIIDLSKRAPYYDRVNFTILDSNIEKLMKRIEDNIDTGNKSGKITITRNDAIKEPLHEYFLKKNKVSLFELYDMKMLFDDSLLRLNSTLNETSADLADTKTDLSNTKTDLADTKTGLANTRTELSQLGETVKQHGEDIEAQGKEITQVRQTADKNKKYVDKYLVNNFQINGESRNLINHLSSLYLENKSNRITINSLRNDFEHFKDETNNRFYKVEKRANQGIASVAAMSNLPFNDAATFSTAMGIGNYRNATAFAWGMQYRINENVKVKASTAWNDANNWVSAGGIGISW
ncbi:YadA-like family protein [Proteus mirabilis]|nr:YadA-like family protein [Proteus mirabilis]